MELSNARSIISTAPGLVVVRFTKADGTLRRMVCIYQGHRSMRPEAITVWDVEKEGLRSINLNSVYSIKVGGREVFATRDWLDICDEITPEELHDLVAAF